MPIDLNFEIILILAVLGVTIFLFVTELFRIDFTAIVVTVSYTHLTLPTILLV